MEESEAILNFDDVAMLPQPGDTAAAAKILIPKGSRVSLPSKSGIGGAGGSSGRFVTLSAPCLEGHRFAIRAVEDGEDLLSWGLPFGHAVGRVKPGDVLINAKAAAALQGRLSGPHGEEGEAIRTLLKVQPVNFVDLDVTPDNPFILEERGFTVVGMNKTVTSSGGEETASFMGYRRANGRGVGTRNHVAVIALTASASPTIVPLRTRWSRYESSDSGGSGARDNFDGVRIVAHTEGESTSVQHNAPLIHRCLAGFLRHANIGAAVVVTTGRERHITRDTLMDFIRARNEEAAANGRPTVYPDEYCREPFVRFVQVSGGGVGDTLRKLDDAVEAAVEHATNNASREPCPLSELCIALQCGGSDSFSGLCGNPLSGEVAARLISQHGGRAILAESPELVGAEPYILSRVSNEETARKFIQTTEAYKEYGARHGLSVAGNPSGGNLYRGLCNIVLKSLGAARKKPPSIALDLVLEHGEPMTSYGDEPKYAFMDSPGNDLESIAGQVASGCNIIIFITGNGSMTNFPFVPTIKVVTTDKRYELIKDDMDVNAGPYGHGGEDRVKAIDDAFDLCVRVASGERSKGETRGHSQVSLWRNFAVGLEDESDVDRTDQLPGHNTSCDSLQLCGQEDPHEVRPDLPPLPATLLSQGPVRRTMEDPSSSSVLRPWTAGASFSLIPTSLCSSAVAVTIKDFIANSANEHMNHIVCPSHTEGCGAAGDAAYNHRYERLIVGHALHPTVCRALFLEHGCEKSTNDYFRNVLMETGALDMNDSTDLSSIFGFWSLQGGGGFDKAKGYVSEYFRHSNIAQQDRSIGKLFAMPWSSRPISVGIMVDSSIATSSGLAPSMGSIVRLLSHLHVHTVLPVNSPLITIESEEQPEKTSPEKVQPPSATADMEDFFAPTAPKAAKPPVRKKQKLVDDKSVSALFAVEALLDATVPSPTLVPGQMISQQPIKGPGGLHVMDLPKGVTWDETISCLSPACDIILLAAAGSEIAMLPGSCLSPTLRRETPPDASDSTAWQQWTAETCVELVNVLRSPIVAGGEADDANNLAALQKSLFSLTTFVVPRGHAVSF